MLQTICRVTLVAAALSAVAVVRPLVGQATGAGRTGIVQGVIKSESGLPIPGAQVTFGGSVVRGLTRADGSFSIVGVQAGVIRLTARRLGYRPSNREVAVPEGGTVRLEIVLTRAPAQMAPITVTARHEPADARLSGFRARAESRAAGYIFTRERIERTANRSTLDLIRGIPGVRVQPAARGSGQGSTIRFRSNRCPPLVFIDGFAATATEFDVSSIDLHMVEGVEVYLSSTSLPAEFFASAKGGEQCGVIAIWSRPVQPRPPRPRRSADAEAAEARKTARKAEQVDEVAYTVGGDPEVVYPDSLWRTSTAGEVSVEFVVDERGRLDWGTLKVLNETHPSFTKSVLEALAFARWEPARLNGRPVSQLVLLPVHFARLEN